MYQRAMPITVPNDSEITDDPLAAIDTGRRHRGQRKIYSVSRSVLLPRVTLKNTSSNSTQACINSTSTITNTNTAGEGVNPLFRDNGDFPTVHQNTLKKKPLQRISRHSSPPSGEKSISSGYGGSHGGSSLEPIYQDHDKIRETCLAILEQNPAFVKSIKIPKTKRNNNRSVPSHSSSSAAGTLTTIPEGKVDFPIPKPIWPYNDDSVLENYDSLVDDALLLYTSLNYNPDNKNNVDIKDISVKELLVELLSSINATMEGKTSITPEQMLKLVNDRIALSLEALKNTTEEEVKKLCINLSNCKKVNSVLRAFSNSSSSGNSSQSSPEWSQKRPRTLSAETEDFYQIPSGSSSSGFSDSVVKEPNTLPVFVHEDLASVPNGVRNAMIYGTLCRGKIGSVNDKQTDKDANVNNNKSTETKKNLIQPDNNKPSVWEQYYGVRAIEEGEAKYVAKPTDVPLFPGGRPEADFTLDVSRSELLSKRMKKDKKWRCRCRLLTSFLGLVFFLLSVMAVSLMLTRGKRMFGSMV